MTNLSLAGKMPALRKSIHLHQWDALDQLIYDRSLLGVRNMYAKTTLLWIRLTRIVSEIY